MPHWPWCFRAEVSDEHSAYNVDGRIDMLWLGNGAEPSCSASTDDASTANNDRRTDNGACSGSSCAGDDCSAADSDDAADYDDRSAYADYDEGRGAGCEHYAGDSGSGDESRNDADREQSNAARRDGDCRCDVRAARNCAGQRFDWSHGEFDGDQCEFECDELVEFECAADECSVDYDKSSGSA